jgi:hypothetical protein
MDPLPLLYGAVFGAWLVLTVFWQFDGCRTKSRLLRRANVLRLLPIWTFFAPRPGMSDTHILYRDRRSDGDVSRWEEIPLIEERRLRHCLWNPRKRLDKLAVDGLSDVKSIKIAADREGLADELVQQQVKLSKGYLHLLNIALTHRSSTTAPIARQFVVVEANQSAGVRETIPLFVSPFHRLES